MDLIELGSEADDAAEEKDRKLRARRRKQEAKSPLKNLRREKQDKPAGQREKARTAGFVQPVKVPILGFG